MKRVFLLIILLVLIQNSFCQNQLGLKFGYNWFTILQSDNHHHPSSFYNEQPSIPVAVFFCQRNHLINFYFEVEYLNRSYSVHEYWGGIGSAEDAEYNIYSSYLNATLAPQFVIGKKIKFIAFPGLYAGIPIYSTIDVTLNSKSLFSGSAKDYIPNVDFGTLIGIGIDIAVSENIIITAQDIFSVSLIPFNSPWKDESYRYMQNKFEVGLAYQFKSRKKDKTKDK